ncbi:MAG: beta strand repeat-containing protein [bacterium]
MASTVTFGSAAGAVDTTNLVQLEQLLFGQTVGNDVVQSLGATQLTLLWPTTGLTLTVTGSLVYNGAISEANFNPSLSTVTGVAFFQSGGASLVSMQGFAPLTFDQLDVLSDPQFVQYYILDAQDLVGNESNNRLSGNALGNMIAGAGGADTLTGLDGNDSLVGGTGNDSVDGGAGSDTLFGDDGDDTLDGGTGGDSIFGGAGNDVIFTSLLSGAIGTDTVNGGDGFDTFQYNVSSTAAITASLAAGTSTSTQGNLTLISIETILGTAGNDSFAGGSAANVIDALGNRVTERFRGDAGNDTITGGAGVDFFTVADYANNSGSQAVSVNLSAGTASDGRSGTDTLVNVDGVRGGSGADTLTGGSLSRGTSGTFFELFRGNAGNDTLNGNNGLSDGVDASGDRADYSNNTSAQAININLLNGGGSDGFGGTDTLIDIDEVYAGAGNDQLTGDAGRNSLDGGAGNDTLDGGAGSDAAHFVQSTAGVIVNLSASAININSVIVAAGTANDGMGGTDTLINIEGVRGSDFADYIRGSDDVSIVETFRGDAGDDTIDGGAGIDYASYSDVPQVLGAVNITLANGSATVNDRKGGTDTLSNIEGLAGTHMNDTLTGGAGDQWLRGNGGSDSLDGGTGIDWVSYLTDPWSVNVNLAGNTGTDGHNGETGKLALGGTDTLLNLENIQGSEYADTLAGNAGDNVIWGEGGNDGRLRGAGGNDTILGGAGNDWIEGETGNDAFVGIAGNDSLDGGTGADIILGGGGNDTMIGGAEIDFLIGEAGDDLASGGAEFDAIDGRAGSDTLNGDGGADIIFGDGFYFSFGWASDTINGGDGDDIIMGEAGENSAFGAADLINGDAGIDQLDGSAGDDTIFGGSGNDVIDGDVGNDVVTGGEGSETMLGSNAVAFGGPTAGNDRFVYTAMADAGDNIYGFDLRVGDADTIDLRPLFDALGYTGSDPRGAGYMLVFQQGANTDVYIDANGSTNGAEWARMLTLVDTTATSVTDSYFLFQ